MHEKVRLQLEERERERPPISDASKAILARVAEICSKGTCSRLLTWPEVAACVRFNHLHLLGRTQEQNRQYDEARNHILKHYDTTQDWIRERKLGAKCQRIGEGENSSSANSSASGGQNGSATGKLKCLFGDDGRKRWQYWEESARNLLPKAESTSSSASTDSSASASQVRKAVLSKPISAVPLPTHHFARNDFPYALDPSISHHLIWSRAPLNVDEMHCIMEEHRPPHRYQTVTFINPPHLQSVKNLWHAHIFSKEKTLEDEPDKSENEAMKKETTNSTTRE